MTPVFKIGTRTSPLAMAQAHLLKNALIHAHPDLKIEIVGIKSKADWKKSEGEKPLSEEQGGKGLFAKEIEEAILNGQVNCGVHSLKDMSSFLPQGLQIRHFLPRANPQDAFISNAYSHISELPEGATIGTCSARRKAIALSLRPDLKILPFRGNVQTRLDKIKEGQVDATFLAMAGIGRLKIKDSIIHPMSHAAMLPACGQGIVCMETQEDDAESARILEAVNCTDTRYSAVAEREVLRALDGSCHTPISAFAEKIGDSLNLRAEVYSLDGAQMFKEAQTMPCSSIEEALRLGQSVGLALNQILPKGFLL